MKKFSIMTCLAMLMVMVFSFATVSAAAPSAPIITDIVPFNQELITNAPVSGNGFWERSFSLASPQFGSRLNFWHRNITNNSVIVRIERFANNRWTGIGQMTIAANREDTRQIPLSPTDFAATFMRITVTNASGAAVGGQVSVRQTNTPL